MLDKIECSVVLLSSEDKAAPIMKNTQTHTLWLASEFLQREKERGIPLEYHHLYVVSDEKIKEGDWVIFPNNKPFRCGSDEHAGLGFQKIIATTDRSLELSNNFGYTQLFPSSDFKLYIPTISGEFVKELIDAYNNYKFFDKVYVDCKKIVWDLRNDKQLTYFGFKADSPGDIIPEIRIVPYVIYDEDNTIVLATTPHKKKRFSRDEVKELFDRFTEFIAHHEPDEWNGWLQKNI